MFLSFDGFYDKPHIKIAPKLIGRLFRVSCCDVVVLMKLKMYRQRVILGTLLFIVEYHFVKCLNETMDAHLVEHNNYLDAEEYPSRIFWDEMVKYTQDFSYKYTFNYTIGKRVDGKLS